MHFILSLLLSRTQLLIVSERHTKFDFFNFIIVICPSAMSSPSPSVPLFLSIFIAPSPLSLRPFPFCHPLLATFLSLPHPSYFFLSRSGNMVEREEGQSGRRERNEGREDTVFGIWVYASQLIPRFVLCCVSVLSPQSVCGCVCFCLLPAAFTVRRHFWQTSGPKAAACWGLEALWAKHRNM